MAATNSKLARWNRFWFSPADPTPLGFIRICCGLLVLYTHLAYSYDLEAFFARGAWIDEQTMNDFRVDAPVVPPSLGWDPDPVVRPDTPEEQAYMVKWGANPRQTVARGHHLWSAWYYVTDPRWMWVVHGFFLGAMACFAVGFGTRVAGLLTWAGVISYIQRAQTSLFGMDTMMNLLVLYLALGPSGAALSVDRLLARRRAARLARARARTPPAFPAPVPSVGANVALRLIQVHFCIIYAMAGLSKLQGAAWWTGTATWGTIANYEFSPFHSRLYAAALHLVASHRWLFELVTTGGTLFTLVFEISFPFLVWTRLRWTMVVCAALLHLGIATCMGLVVFGLFMVTGVASFLEPAALHTALARLRAHSPWPAPTQRRLCPPCCAAGSQA